MYGGEGLDYWTLNNFTKFIREFQKKITDTEINMIFKHFDRGGNGQVSLEEFMQAFDRRVEDEEFETKIDDILKPL